MEPSRTSIDYIVSGHFIARSSSLLFVNRVGLEPVVMRNETELYFRICQLSDAPREPTIPLARSEARVSKGTHS